MVELRQFWRFKQWLSNQHDPTTIVFNSSACPLCAFWLVEISCMSFAPSVTQTECPRVDSIAVPLFISSWDEGLVYPRGAKDESEEIQNKSSPNSIRRQYQNNHSDIETRCLDFCLGEKLCCCYREWDKDLAIKTQHCTSYSRVALSSFVIACC